MAFGVSSSRNKVVGSSFFRYVRGFSYLILGIVILIGLAPTIIAKTSLSNWLIGRATAGMPVRVMVGNLSLGWFSHVRAQDVVVRDLNGGPVAEMPRAEIDRTLLQLLMSRADLGKIHIERPSVDVIFAKDSSNLEKILSDWPAQVASAKPAPAAPGRPTFPTLFQFEVVEGTVRVVDADLGKAWQLAHLDVRLANDNVGNLPLKGRVAADVAGAGEPGSIVVDMRGAAGVAMNGTGDMKFKNIPVALFAPLLRRGQGDFQCDGQLQTEGGFAWMLAPNNMPILRVRCRVDGKNLEATGGALGADRAVIRQLTSLLDLEYGDSQVNVDCKEFKCDVGQASGKARIALNRSLVANLSEPGTALAFELNLAELAQRLPKTLNLHKGVSLTAGEVKFEGKSGRDEGQPLWEGKLTTTEIRGLRNNAPIAWKDPLALEFKIRQSTRAWPDIQELRCQSQFIAIKGSANASELHLSASADLGQLATPLGQFVDLGAWGLGGLAEATLEMKLPAANLIVIDANATLKGFQWGPWREDRLVLKANAEVRTVDEKYAIDKSAALRVASGNDLLEVTLREPLTLTSTGQTGALYAKLDGDLTRWQQRLKNIAPALGDFALEGQAKAQAWFTLTPRRVEVQPIVLAAQNFAMNVNGVKVRDPNLEVQASMIYGIDEGVVDLKDSQLRSQGLVLHTTKLHVDLKRKMMAGNLVYRGDLGKLQSWFAPPAPGADVWAGALFGKADLVSGADGFEIDTNATIKALAYGPPQAPRFTDPNVQLIAKGNFSSKSGTLQFDKLQLVSQLGGVDAKVRLAKLDTTLDLEAVGSLDYDLSQLEPLAKAYLGAGARVQGKDRREFRAAGPLRPKGAAPGAAIEMAALQGNAAVSWQQIVGYGAVIGPADLKANFQGGWIKIDPVVASINQGRLRLAPSLRFDPVGELTLPAGPFIENAKITPEMCASALGYALPMLANVAQAEGEFSLQFDYARMPFGDPSKGEAQGVLRMHHAKVGPGPLVSELTGILKTATPFSVIRDNQIKFKFEKGRVYHENLELILPDNIVIRTSGSVGLDGTLDMIAEAPLPARLLGNIKLPAEIARRPIRLPISGTVERPRIDARGLQDALKGAARDATGDLLLKGLDKLIRPR
jgi:translocation and assembly module TamB